MASWLADLLLPVLRHHALMLFVIIVGGEIEIVVAQFEAEFLGRGFEHPHALRHRLLADAVARNDGDAIDAVGGLLAVAGGVHGGVSSRLALSIARHFTMRSYATLVALTSTCLCAALSADAASGGTQMRLGLFMMPVHPRGPRVRRYARRGRGEVALCRPLGFDELWLGEHFSATTEPIPVAADVHGEPVAAHQKPHLRHRRDLPAEPSSGEGRGRSRAIRSI